MYQQPTKIVKSADQERKEASALNELQFHFVEYTLVLKMWESQTHKDTEENHEPSSYKNAQY